MTPLMIAIVFAQIPKQAPFLVRPVVAGIAAGVNAQFIRPRLKANYGFVEEWLKVGQGRLTLIREFKLSVRAIVSCYASRKGGNKRNETNLFQ